MKRVIDKLIVLGHDLEPGDRFTGQAVGNRSQTPPAGATVVAIHWWEGTSLLKLTIMETTKEGELTTRHIEAAAEVNVEVLRPIFVIEDADIPQETI